MSRHQIPAEAHSNFVPSEGEVVHPKNWHELAETYVLLARQDGSDLSGLLIDLNATKAANDELGHEAGTEFIDMVDALKTEIPQQVRHDRISSGGRPVDIVTSHPSNPAELNLFNLVLPEPQTARIGGDEFGILLPHTDAAGAQAVKERLLNAVGEKLQLPEYERLRKVGVGIAVGVATLSPTMSTAADFLRAIDKSMYADKINQLPELSPTEQAEFVIAVRHLKKADVRARDVPKYIEKYGAAALAEALEDRDRATD